MTIYASASLADSFAILPAMPREIVTAIFVCLCATSLGCNAEPKSAPGQHAPPAEAHADPAASPHAQAPAANPHAQMPQVKPPGPPREVTPSGETREEIVDGLKLAVPSEWVRGTASSSMRKAELTLPGPGGDVTLVVYRFKGGAGSTQANIERWEQQIALAEGAEVQTSEIEPNGLKVTSVDMRGAYAGQSMPGAPPQPPVADARMLAAAIEGSGDPWYFKLVGPAATIDVWGDAWTKLLSELAPAA